MQPISTYDKGLKIKLLEENEFSLTYEVPNHWVGD